MSTETTTQTTDAAASHHHEEPTGIWSWITTVDHKRIGIMYFLTSMSFRSWPTSVKGNGKF